MTTIELYKKLVIIAIILLTGCAHRQPVDLEKMSMVFYGLESGNNQIDTYAPYFLVYEAGDLHNRIGQVMAESDARGKERIFVSVDRPAIYFTERRFTTDKGEYTNLIYRIHFPETPHSLVPFNLTAGKNVGLITIVTLDSRDRPVLVTAVHTCGCYRIIIPTSYLPEASLPRNWKGEPLDVYGEKIPARLDYHNRQNPKLLVYLRPEVHRVMNIEIIDDRDPSETPAFSFIGSQFIDIDNLRFLPYNGGTASFYHDSGFLRGHVKGAVKPWETLLLGLISLDFYVGTDKIYGDSEETGNIFYTSLKPWYRKASDMWDFAGFLKFWGWNL
ncbi:hypothetical protein ACFL9U_11885 [Thermodesulfobacteriota bacterium]